MRASAPPQRSTKRDRIVLSRSRSSPPPMISRWPVRRVLRRRSLIAHHRERHAAVAARRGVIARHADQANLDIGRDERDAALERLGERRAGLEPFVDAPGEQCADDVLAYAGRADRAGAAGPEAAAGNRRVTDAPDERR